MAVAKGIAFPTCVSVNECVTNNSPLESEASKHVRGRIIYCTYGLDKRETSYSSELINQDVFRT